MATRGGIEIKGLDELKQGLTEFQQTLYPTAMRNALNDVAFMAKAAVVDQMKIDLDRPTPFTLNAMTVDKASKDNLVARVRFKDPERLSDSQHYLYPTTYGVVRGFKKFEAALLSKRLIPSGWMTVPGKDQPLDAYGNVSGGLMKEILAWFEANPVREGYQNNMTDATRNKRRTGTRSTLGYEFFVLKNGKGKMPPGIYRRVFLPYQPGEASSKTYLIFLYVPKSHVWYAPKYTFHQTARDVFNANLKDIFGREMQINLEKALK